jgi:hypothetical protein
MKETREREMKPRFVQSIKWKGHDNGGHLRSDGQRQRLLPIDAKVKLAVDGARFQKA